jgi:hydroxyacylglutathione hydrolase
MVPRVVPVPCLRDNYAYLVSRPDSKQAIVVDASEGEPVLRAAEREGLEIVGVLATHHHHDHVGGNEEVAAKNAGIEVVCSEYDKDRVPAVTKTVVHGQSFELAGMTVRVLAVPGHTLGAVAYVIGDAVFTGDTMFVAGCGRLFEGTPAQMWDSLKLQIASLPLATRVYVGHEYTLSNARFAKTIDSANPAVDALIEKATAAREAGLPTVPSTVADELAFNPFLRVAEPAFTSRFGDVGEVSVLAAVRKAKDDF